MRWLTDSAMARRVAPVLLAVTLTFSASACDSGDDSDVDQTEEQVEDQADQTEDDLEDQVDEKEKEIREKTP
jgi:hypothetical protein